MAFRHRTPCNGCATLTATSTWTVYWRRSNASSASILSNGLSALNTGKRVHSSCCRRSCIGSSNGGGRIEREYALGRRRTDLLIVWPPSGPEGAKVAGPARRHVVECKVLRGGLESTIREGVEQTLDYVDKCRAESGHLVVFDRTESKPWEEKLYRREESLGGRPVTVWGA